MKKTIHICSKCGAEKITTVDSNEKAGYRTIDFRVGKIDIDDFTTYSSYQTEPCYRLKTVYLCPKCYLPLGIATQDGAYPIKQDEIKTVADRLYDLFVEIISETIGNRES